MAKHKKQYQRLTSYYWRTSPNLTQGSLSWYLQTAKCYRNLATTNERRQNCAAQADGHYIRGKRRHKHLPTTWDDKGVGRWCVRSWKDGTRCAKQWLVKE